MRTAVERLGRLLSEPVMGFLALAALSGGIAPMLFALAPQVARGIAILEWAIIAAFAAEYLVHLVLARDRARYVLNPWRILDLVIVLAPLASLLPFAPDYVRSSPALRVLRLVRVLLFGARVHHGLAAGAQEARRDVSGPVRVSALSPGEPLPREARWEELLRSGKREWIHAANLQPSHIRELAAALKLPEVMVEAALRETSYPRLESSDEWCAFSLALPGSRAEPRTPVLLLVSEHRTVSLSLYPAPVQAAPGLDELPWGTRCALHVVREVLRRNEALAGRIEDELRRLETLDADQSPAGFFADVFRLKRSLALARGDLWRLRALLGGLAGGKRGLPGLDAARDCVRELSEQADYLHETVEKAQEQLLTLLDLHLNIASYDVNRFMRLLAVVSSLAIIPTIIGGLLGMNILGNPWPVTLTQVAFATFILMACVLYAFLAKGWLR